MDDDYRESDTKIQEACKLNTRRLKEDKRWQRLVGQ